MRPSEKRKIRETLALRRLQAPISLDSKLLRKQINSLSDLVQVTNDRIGEDLTGAVMILELFEWLPKGEYVISIKIV